jgi:uncharacterized protein (TIGR02588 family)
MRATATKNAALKSRIKMANRARPQIRNGSPSRARATNAPQATHSRESEIPLLEWIAGALGLAAVTAMILFMLYHAVTGSDSPPDLEVKVASVAENRSGYLVSLTIRNQGGATAEGVIVEGELRDADQLLERSQTTVDYTPPHSEKQAGLFFTRDPRQFNLQIRALGYEKP